MTIFQLPLQLIWPDLATFDNFYVGPNGQILDCLRETAQKKGQKRVYLQGESGVGLSHLLYAMCHTRQKQGGTATYVSFKNIALSPAILEGIENISLVCWDDLECVAGNRAWEEALFHCYNRMQITQTCLVMASHIFLNEAGWSLPDLKSRFSASTIFTVQALSDLQKMHALQERAKRRGLELSDEVGSYLLKHAPRDMHALFDMLEKLDRFSLSTQRRLTIPFVKEILHFKNV